MTTLTHDEIHAGVAELLHQIIEVPAAEIAVDARLVEDLAVDSLSLVELTIGVEERFGVRIADAQVAGLATVAEVVDLIAAAV